MCFQMNDLHTSFSCSIAQKMCQVDLYGEHFHETLKILNCDLTVWLILNLGDLKEKYSTVK